MQISKGKALGCTQLEMNKPEGEYSEDESDEDNAVFATQVSAQRFVYPTVVPPQLQPPMPMKSTMPSPKMMGKVDLQVVVQIHLDKIFKLLIKFILTITIISNDDEATMMR